MKATKSSQVECKGETPDFRQYLQELANSCGDVVTYMVYPGEDRACAKALAEAVKSGKPVTFHSRNVILVGEQGKRGQIGGTLQTINVLKLPSPTEHKASRKKRAS